MQRLNLVIPYLIFGLIVTVVVLTNIPVQRVNEPAGTAAVCMPCGMEVDPAHALRKSIDGKDLLFCSSLCYEQMRDRLLASGTEAHGSAKHIDVVCNMEVNPAWGFVTTYRGTDYYFCTQRCQELFVQEPQVYLSEKCVVCKKPIDQRAAYKATYLGNTYRLCSAEHRQQFKADPATYFMHSMWGIPSWLYYASIALVLVASFGVFDWLFRRSSSPAENKSKHSNVVRAPLKGAGERLLTRLVTTKTNSPSIAAALSLPVVNLTAWDVATAHSQAPAHHDRIELTALSWLRAAAHSRRFRFALQFTIVALFLLVIAAGLFGNQNPALNIAPLLTWTIWWGLLPIFILFAGKIWCYVCPWDALAGWIEKLKFWEKTDEGLSLNWRWPRLVRNISIATLLFVGLTWVELGFGVTMNPQVTAYLALAMLFLALISVLLFQRKSFCRYGCLVGRISGLYAMFGATEVRARHAEVCTACKTKECIHGSREAYGCPTFLYPGKLQANTYCIQCMECLQACPHDNLAVNLRPWGSDLEAEQNPRSDEAYLALLMLSITGFHGLTMTPAWQQLIEWIRSSADVGRVLGFSVGMALIMIAPIAVYAVLIAISKHFGEQRMLNPLRYRDYFIRYAYALLPIALFYHIAHNLEHLLMEGPKVIALLSDPFGWNWNVFGTAGWNVPPLVSLSNLWLIQVLLVLIGHVYSLWIAQKTSLRLFGSSKAAFRSQLPMLIGMIAFSVFSLWLLKQPMEMRTSVM